jgi:hypothetical protein
MPTDPGYQATPAPRRPATEPAPSSHDVPADLQLPASIWWTGWQLAFVAVEAAALVVVFLWMYVLQYDYLSPLWQTPTGMRMLIMGVLLLILNFAGFLGICLWLNHATPAGDERRQGRRAFGHAAAALLFLLLFYAPVFFVILVGPAAIAIQENLR